MSFLLDALRKSELERKIGEVPKFMPELPVQPARPARHPFLIAIVALVVINLVTLSYFILREKQQPVAPGQGLPEPGKVAPGEFDATLKPKTFAEGSGKNQHQNDALAKSNTRVPETPVRQERPLEIPRLRTLDTNRPASGAEPNRNTPRDLPAERIVQIGKKPAPLPESGPLQTSRNAEPSPLDQIRSTPLSRETLAKPDNPSTSPERASIQPLQNPSPDPVPASTAKRVNDAIPLLSGMPRDFQRDIPSLKINVFVYSEAPDERFVIVNMTKYSAGQQIEGGPRILEIRPDSLVLEHLGRTFRILRP